MTFNASPSPTLLQQLSLQNQCDYAQSPAFTKIVKTPSKFERLSEFELDQSKPLLVVLAESASDLLCCADSSASESPSRSRHLVGDDQDLAGRERPDTLPRKLRC
jgi:hypothetical protein